MAGAALALLSLAGAQGHGSAAVANVDPPEAALFPDLVVSQDPLEEQGWMLRGQAAFLSQGHPRFNSSCRGAVSLSPAANARTILSTDLIRGRRPWRGAEVTVDASVTRGFGLSNSIGTAAFRLGSTEATFFVTCSFLRQVTAFSGKPYRMTRICCASAGRCCGSG